MDWDQLRIILAVHRSGSLRGAGEALGINHATVARALQGAEEKLGARLFDRSKQGLRATQSGEVLLPHAEEMEAHVLEVQRRLSGLDATPSGVVRVSMPPSLATGIFLLILKGFTERYPDIEIQVLATNRVSDLSRHEADVSIRAAHQVDDDTVVGRRVASYRLAAFASRSYLEAHPNLAATKGEGAHWIGFAADDAWTQETPLPLAKARHRLPEVDLQLGAAAAGIGMAWVPAFMGELHAGIQRIPDVPTSPGRGLWILLHGDLRRTARVRAVVDYVADWMAQNRPLLEG